MCICAAIFRFGELCGSELLVAVNRYSGDFSEGQDQCRSTRMNNNVNINVVIIYCLLHTVAEFRKPKYRVINIASCS